MPLALIIGGAFLGILAVNGKYPDALKLLGNAVNAPSAGISLLEAGAGIVLIAAIFRLIELPKAGEAFLVLILVVFMTQKGPGFLREFEKAFGTNAKTGSTPAATGATTPPATGATTPLATGALTPSTPGTLGIGITG